MIYFTNKGEISPTMLETFGVSSKETNSPIGQFGTGLKYAIAVLLRNNRKIHIKSGQNEYSFSTVEQTIRNKQFQRVTCNGKELPFTTELGKNWEVWQAYRELYSNCLDEQGCLGDHLDTVIAAELDDINHNGVFLERNDPLLRNSGCEVYPGKSKYLYHKGIRTSQLKRSSYFTYNILEADLTEDRTFKYPHQIDRAVGNLIMEDESSDFAYDFLTKTIDYEEERLNVGLWASPPCGELLKIVDKLRKEDVYLQQSLAQLCIDQLGDAKYLTEELTPRQTLVVNKARGFLKGMGVTLHQPVLLCNNLGRNVLALAQRKTGTILLSDTVLSQGSKQVAATLYEEWVHLEKGFDDCTYQMQNFLFDKIITLQEELTGEIL